MSADNKLQSIRIEISEPWDFDIPGRGNILECHLEGTCQGPMERNWEGKYFLVSFRHPINWKKQIIKQCLISPRYKTEEQEHLRGTRPITVGIARVKPEYYLIPGKSFKKEQVEYFAIGSAQLA